jgi:hypothetical protein
MIVGRGVGQPGPPTPYPRGAGITPKAPQYVLEGGALPGRNLLGRENGRLVG